MAHHHNRVDIEHGPIHFAIREDQLQLTPTNPTSDARVTRQS